MGLLDNLLSGIDSFKRKTAKNIWDAVTNPSDFANMTAARMQEDRYGGPEEAYAMKQYLSQQPHDKEALKRANEALARNAVNESLGAVTVWHGSPHRFNKFDMSKIGTGEGAQAYGHGLYMAESPNVADEYAGKLSDVVVGFKNKEPVTAAEKRLAKLIESAARTAQYESRTESANAAYLRVADPVKDILYGNSFVGIKPLPPRKLGEALAMQRAAKRLGPPEIFDAGNLYKVDIPDEAVSRFLDWDRPINQSQDVVSAVQKDFPSYMASGLPKNDSVKARDAYEFLVEKLGKDNATEYLKQQGIPGIRYLDGGSRSAGQGSSNYVLFDDQMPRILEINGQPTGLQPWQQGEWQGLLGR